MIHNECTEFFQQVENHFHYLFDEYGFSIVDKRGDGVHCLIVIQSGDCQIRFLYDRGIVETSAGTSEHVYNIFWVVNFIKEQSPPSSEEVKQTMELFWLGKMEEGLNALSKMLRPVCKGVMELFQKETFRKKRKEFEQFYYE